MNTQEQLEAVRKESAAWKEMIERRDALEAENTMLSACLKKAEQQRDDLRESLEGVLRILEAVKYQVGLGKNQLERMAKAKELIAKLRD